MADNAEDRRQERRRFMDSFLPSADQQRQIDHIMELEPDEQKRVHLFMLVSTRDELANHQYEETRELITMKADLVDVREQVSRIHEALYGDDKPDSKNKGAVEAIGQLTEVMNRITIWLNGGCWVLKTGIPVMATVIAAGYAVGKYYSWWA